MQSATAFGQIHDSLSFFRNAYDEFASYRAAIIRLDGMLKENRAPARSPLCRPPRRRTVRCKSTVSKSAPRTESIW